MSKKIALIDGYGFVFRAFHSLPPLTRPDGTPVGAVYGFTNMLIKLLAGLNVTHAAVVFDSGSKTFRNDIYPAYKANRPPCPEELIPQFSIVRESAESLNLSILEKIGFEADDIIATIAKKAEIEGYEVLIVSSDKDLMQLVGENIHMYDSMKNRMIGIPQVIEKFEVGPEKVLDMLSLIGDTSDNIPGVKGIGPKTAAELIKQFGNLENIFENLHQIKQEKRRQLLSEGIEKAKLSKILAALKEDVELGIHLDELEIRALDPHKLISFLQIQGFHSLITRVRKEFGISENAAVPVEKQILNQVHDDDVVKSSQELRHPELDSGSSVFSSCQKTLISSPEIIARLNKEASTNGQVTIDRDKNFITISTCKSGDSPKEILYFEVKKSAKTPNQNHSFDLFSFNHEPEKIETEGFDIEILEKILTDDSIKKIFFDAKNFLKFSPANSYEDVATIHHLLTSSVKNDLRELIDLNLNEDVEQLGFGKVFAEIEKDREPEIFADPEKKAEFLTFRNFAIYQLYKIFAPKIAPEKLTEAYLSFERPLIEVLAQIETNGIKIDVAKLRQLSQEFGKKIAELSSEIYILAGHEFNIASAKQLSEVLFEKMGLASGKKSKKTGALSTGVGVLEELDEAGNPIARKILDFRKFSKLKNTYTDALPEEINPQTGRIHTHFSTTSTITGRLSSRYPNLQNIPIKSLEGQKIRESFIAEKNHFLISADYSQIELRVIAHAAKIGNLINAFKEDKDIHRITAAQVFGVTEDEVDDSLRSKAKAINFGIIYGISAFGLARQLDIPRQEAAIYIKSYLETYPGIDISMKNYIELARKNGYVQTLSGRKCFIRDINNKNPMIRAEAERLAINAPIQGSAADIIKKAMIRLSKRFKEENLQSKIILQIHDELIVEAPENEVEIATKILKYEMENAAILDVPLKVDVTVADCWK
ncbi:MAG: DNA polymerase I [Pseudomonadota bacterium]